MHRIMNCPFFYDDNLFSSHKQLFRPITPFLSTPLDESSSDGMQAMLPRRCGRGLGRRFCGNRIMHCPFLSGCDDDLFSSHKHFFHPITPFLSTPFDESSSDDRMQVMTPRHCGRGFGRCFAGNMSRRCQMNETDSNVELSIDIPGVKASDINIQLEDNRVLNLSGEREFKKGDSTTKSKFEKRYMVGENIKADSIKAEMDNGVLKISAEKIKPVPESTIKIPVTQKSM